MQTAYVRRAYAFLPSDLQAALRQLGITVGDVLMVHSSFDALQGFRGNPADVIATLEAVVEPEGMLIMPTLPFSGSAVEYALQDPIFDAQRTTSRMGLITEVFRRSSGVLRSLHPTHSVAVWGGRAKELVCDHHLARTPCGPDTPYGRLMDLRGKILFLGVPVRTMTFIHFVEEALEPLMPVPVFAPSEYALRFRTPTGEIRVANMRLFSPQLAGHRDGAPLIAELKRRGWWRQRQVGRVQMILLEARDVYEVARDLARRGVLWYDFC
jgi:aminoglycoside N3'-acetyltransferase